MDESRDEVYANSTNGHDSFRDENNGRSTTIKNSRRAWNGARAETEQEEQGGSRALDYMIHEPKPTMAAIFEIKIHQT
jgi:hypothetical protein